MIMLMMVHPCCKQLLHGLTSLHLQSAERVQLKSAIHIFNKEKIHFQSPFLQKIQFTSDKRSHLIQKRRISAPSIFNEVTQETRNSNFISDLASENKIARVVLKSGKVRIFKSGNPMVYSGAIDCVIGRPPPSAGDVVVVEDASHSPFAWGMFNPHSMFRVRILQTETEAKNNTSSVFNVANIIRQRVKEAVELRKALSLPSPSYTSVYRLINSEGDRLSGIVADVIGGSIVVLSSSYWVEKHRHHFEDAFRDEFDSLSSIVWRRDKEMLSLEGFDPDEEGGEKEGEGRPAGDDPASSSNYVQVLENGIHYFACTRGQKTGFYADQRENRLFVQNCISKGRSVLDLCCYSGGFALNALKGGASHVTGVDSSAEALRLANQNAELNQFDPQTFDFVQSDVMEFMKQAIKENRKWDLIILDPPKLAPNKNVLKKALVRYKRLNSMAMKLVSHGGLLMTCSCSGAVSQTDTFLPMLQESADSIGRNISILRKAGASPDHPILASHIEGLYLTNVILSVI